MHAHPLAALLVVACLLTACASTPRDPRARPDDAAMTLVYLQIGSNSASHTPEQKSEIFKGHMANMQRLAAEKQLIIAGPFGQPRNPAWRGIFVFDIAEARDAEAVGATDPGVAAGEFKLVVRPITASATLREALRLEDEMQAELKAAGQPERKPGEPPPGLRRYVMMHAEDFARARAVLPSGNECQGAVAAGEAMLGRPLGPNVVWCASFRDGKDGVFVLDASDVDRAESALRGLDVGPFGLDRWMSTKAQERLARGVAQ